MVEMQGRDRDMSDFTELIIYDIYREDITQYK